MKLPSSIQDLSDRWKRLPGVGEKTALRYTLAMTRYPKEDLVALSQAILNLLKLEKCEECGAFSEGPLCSLCTDPYREAMSSICVVESFVDYLAILRSNQFRGLFHLLGGVLNPLMGIGPEQLTIDKLLSRIKAKGINEMILALNPSVEGDMTCAYIKSLLDPTIKVERIGIGIPMGGGLEYLDALTIGRALENRQSL